MLRIRILREASGMTLKELGEKIGQSPSAVHYFETGVRDPKSTQLLQIAQALNVEVGALYSPEGAAEYVETIKFPLEEEVHTQSPSTPWLSKTA